MDNMTFRVVGCGNSNKTKNMVYSLVRLEFQTGLWMVKTFWKESSLGLIVGSGMSREPYKSLFPSVLVRP